MAISKQRHFEILREVLALVEEQLSVPLGVAAAHVGVGDDTIANEREPHNLTTGITIVGKRAHIPANTIIGRNCRIDANVTPESFTASEIPSGATVLA